MNEKKVCLVTGGAGFIGSNLCKLLLFQNKHVICMDNLSSGKKENISELLENRDFEFVYQDVHYFVVAMDMEQNEFEKILKNFEFF